MPGGHPGTGIIDSHEPVCGCSGLNLLGSMGKHPVFVITDLSSPWLCTVVLYHPRARFTDMYHRASFPFCICNCGFLILAGVNCLHCKVLRHVMPFFDFHE